MCYAIPGKVVKVEESLVTLDYFGEEKKARNEFFPLSAGEYAYAQGGFIIQKIPSREALPILDSWQELFFKLKEIDLRLSSKTSTLYQRANNIRQLHHGNSCCVHGIIEFSNYCLNDCLYCGIRKANRKLTHYRMSSQEIIAAAEDAVKHFGFKALVLQSGQDSWYDQDKLTSIVEGIQKRSPCLISVSIGERSPALYQGLYRAGARGVLLRFETSNPSLYAKVRPGHALGQRLSLIRDLNQIGYLVMTGFLIGLPGQRKEDIIKDIELTASLSAEMFSFGPFIAHPDTPLAGLPALRIEEVLDIIADCRIKNPQAKILVTTALETLDKKNALRLGLMAGANSIMVNLTPERYRKLYEIYPDRAGIELPTEERIEAIIKLLHSLGRAPTDLGI